MEKENKNPVIAKSSDIFVSEFWQPTMMFRWFSKRMDGLYNVAPVLQQKWVSNTGEEEWREIETVIE